jgi:hypothetical protein
VVLDQVDIAFDDEHAVASAGLLLAATLAERLGIERAADQLVDLGGRPGAARPGPKLLTLVHAVVAGGDGIDDVELLRCGSTASVLGHRVMAASTVGTWLRSFTSGHVRQLDRFNDRSYAVARRWAGHAFRGVGGGSAWRVVASCQRSLTAPRLSLGSRRSRCSTTKPTRTRATWRTTA